MSAGLGQKIASAVEQTFNQLNLKSGKPTNRSNGVKEWTVLAGVVAVENGDISVLTVTTGVKAMPDRVRSYSRGLIVHDMHAEILSLRLLNLFWVQQMVKMNNGQPHANFLQETSGHHPYRLRQGVQLALYISEPPCGDASMGHISKDKPAWEPDTKKRKVMRGRAHFDVRGIVRTKPGRADSQPTYSKSCSDKLCVKQYTGVLNCITSLLIEPMYLQYLVLREDKLNMEDFERCFYHRVEALAVERLVPLTYKDTSYSFYKDDSNSPLPVSLLYTVPTHTTQVLVNGVKNGGFIKNRPPKPSGASVLCKHNLYREAQVLLPRLSMYSDVKKANLERQQLKQTVRSTLGLWPVTSEDDFPLFSLQEEPVVVDPSSKELAAATLKEQLVS